ncbi:hypothetical protein SAMN04487988_10851 [Algoriphagus hitonicola]|uniref:Uncharacterized protein n=1 Tax=Algoriphagus hitonicola TaxID=435880 RepID=A0A1I2UP70_9BACT|nr:hypothetical protein SAMN04487988_10851 [Algoriphagus hitonicola]
MILRDYTSSKISFYIGEGASLRTKQTSGDRSLLKLNFYPDYSLFDLFPAVKAKKIIFRKKDESSISVYKKPK